MSGLSLPYRALRHVFRLAFRLFAHVEVTGLEHTPMEGPLIVAANHINSFDSPLLFAFLPRHPISALAKVELQGTPVAWLVEMVDGIYVARGEIDRQALRAVLAKLHRGEAIGIAPEGTRSRTGKLGQGRGGVAYLALESDAWILPVATWGQEQVASRIKRFQRPTIHLHIGEPFKLSPDPALNQQKNIQRGTQQLMLTIAALLPPAYRGVYESPSDDKTPSISEPQDSAPDEYR
jgi:1-acyl-sn-glycerol-3-phosphate acyltransferase